MAGRGHRSISVRGSPWRSLTVHGRRRDGDAALDGLVAATTRNDLGDLRVRELIGRHLDWRGDGLDDPNRFTLQHVVDPILGGRLAAMLTAREITTDLGAAYHSGLDRAEVRNALGLLRNAYRWAGSQGWCAHNPAEDIIVGDIV